MEYNFFLDSKRVIEHKMSQDERSYNGIKECLVQRVHTLSKAEPPKLGHKT